MIETRALGKQFGGQWAVRNLSLAVPRGAIFGLLGPNGAGKTTTLRLLSGLISPSVGEGWVAGFDLGRRDAAMRRCIGLLPGEPGLYETLSCEANLEFHARLHGMNKAERHERVRQVLELVELLDRRAERVGAFSKGMKQRLALARTLLHNPPVLLLDEPTSGLDPAAARRVRDLLANLRRDGHTILLSTHDLEEARQLCDQVCFLRMVPLRVDTPEAISRTLFGRRVRLRLANPSPELLAIVRELPFVQDVEVDASGMRLTLTDADADAPALVRALVEAGGEIVRLEEEQHSLEEAYLEIVTSRGDAR